ncbi:trans-aconitate 2-methyltransferase, partial [bacterium]|nr:trans-aconitate 2-methyltransferase [bacterium]
WLPDHETLIGRLFDRVAEGGALAVQVPANSNSPLHQAVLRTARSPEWRETTACCEGLITYHNADFYYDRLSALAGRVDIWETTYFHVMESMRDLVEWYASTGLRPYLDRLAGDSERETFIKQILDECASGYPLRRDGRVLFPFKRLFFIATRD